MPNRTELQALILETTDLNSLIRLGKEVSLYDLHSEGFVYFTLAKKEFNRLYGSLPIFNGVEVSEARLHVSMDKDGKPTRSSIYLKFVTGDHTLIPLDVKQLHKIDSLFQKEGRFYPINSAVHKRAYNWSENPMSYFYDQKIHEHYARLHDQVKNALIKLLKEYADHSFNIIDGGCGTGKLLQKLAIELPSKLSLDKETKTETPTVPMHLFGFDFNALNVQASRKLFEEAATVCRFETGDLTKADVVLEHFRQKNSHIPKGELTLIPGAKNVLILSGSLTRQVLKNNFEALKALHSIALSEQVDFLMGGGLGEPLINHYMAKQSGFKLVPLLPNDQHTFPKSPHENTKFFAFERMSQEEVLEIKIKKMMKRNTLDLSLSPAPEKLLGALLEKIEKGELTIREGLLINLSFAKISDETLVQLKLFLQKCPNAVLALRHNDKECIEKLRQYPELLSRFINPPELVFNDVEITSSRFIMRPYAPLTLIPLLLAEGYADPAALFIQALEAKNWEVVAFFINHCSGDTPQFPKINWNEQNSEGNTLVHIAAQCDMNPNSFSKITTLNWDLRNKAGQTALEIFQLRQSPSLNLMKNILFGAGYEPDEIDAMKVELKALVQQGIDLVEVAKTTQDQEIIDFATELTISASCKSSTARTSQSGHFAHKNQAEPGEKNPDTDTDFTPK